MAKAYWGWTWTGQTTHQTRLEMATGSVGLGQDREVTPTNPDIEFFAMMDREVTPSNPDMDTS